MMVCGKVICIILCIQTTLGFFGGTKMKSLSCPVVFLVGNDAVDTTNERGMSLMNNGIYASPTGKTVGVLLSQLKEMFSECTTIIPVRIDKETTQQEKIETYTREECLRRRRGETCFILTEHEDLGKTTLVQMNHVEDIVRRVSKTRTLVHVDSNGKKTKSFVWDGD